MRTHGSGDPPSTSEPISGWVLEEVTRHWESLPRPALGLKREDEGTGHVIKCVVPSIKRRPWHQPSEWGLKGQPRRDSRLGALLPKTGSSLCLLWLLPIPLGLVSKSEPQFCSLEMKDQKPSSAEKAGFRLREAKLEHNFHVDSWQKGLIWIM